jgi:hypothetical protein
MPRMVRRRPLALAVALIAVALAGPADAKKKKGGKKGKTPAGKSSGKSSKSLGAEPSDTSGADDSSSSSSSATDEEEDTKPAAKAPPPDITDQKPPSDEPEDKPAPKKKKVAAAEGGGDDEAGPALPALEFVGGLGAMFRNLAYNDDRSMAVAPYSLAPGAMARIGLDVYPAAFGSSGFAGNIGLTAQLGYGFAVKSQTQTMPPVQLTTQFMDYAVGLKLRIPLGMAIPYVFGTYASQIFQLTGQNPTTTGPPVPAVAYSIIRPGVGARFVFSPMIDLDVSAAFLLLMDAGQIRSAAFWPHATGNGFEAALSLGVRFTPLIGVRAGVDFRQYGLAFNWRSGEMFQAGGAIDRYIVAWGGLQITLDGAGGGAASEPPAEEKPAKGKKKKPEAEPEPEPEE